MIGVAIPVSAIGIVELRLVPLSFDEAEFSRLSSTLCPQELQRGERYLDKDRGKRFLTGRGVLRELLSVHLGEDAAAIRFREGAYGKLGLMSEGECTLRQSQGERASQLSFNLSHAGGYMLVAIADGRAVGVDLEQVRQDLPYHGMAERYFSKREREELFALDEAEQLAAFYRCWTRKEAYMKGAGTGFSQPSTGFDVSLHPAAPAALLAHSGNPAETSRWTITDLEAPVGFCAALAIEG